MPCPWRFSQLPQTVGEQVRAARISAMERTKAALCAAQAKEAYALAQDIISRYRSEGIYKKNPARGVGAEVALARKETQHGGPRFVNYSRSPIEQRPYIFDALVRGELTEERAMLMVSKTRDVYIDIRRQIDRHMAGERGALEGVGTKQLAARMDKAVLSYDSRPELNKHADAMNKRRVTVSPTADGMMRLTAWLTVPQGIAMKQALSAAASKRRPADDPRTDDHTMADTLVQRTTGQDNAPCPPLLANLTMTDQTLLAGDSEPAHLQGYGTISATFASWLITGDHLEWEEDNDVEAWVRRVYTAPSSGELIAMDSEARIAPVKLKELIAVRDQFCRTPYCDAPIRHIDHVYQAAKGGKTSELNLDGRCAWCSQSKETSGWEETVVQGLRHSILIATPGGQMYRGTAPPLPGTPEAPPKAASSPAPESPFSQTGALRTQRRGRPMARKHQCIFRIPLEQPCRDVIEQRAETLGIVASVANAPGEQRIATENHGGTRAVTQHVGHRAGGVATQMHTLQDDLAHRHRVPMLQGNVDCYIGSRSNTRNVICAGIRPDTGLAHIFIQCPDVVPVLMGRGNARQFRRGPRIGGCRGNQLVNRRSIVGGVDQQLCAVLLGGHQIDVVGHIGNADGTDGRIREIKEEFAHSNTLRGRATCTR